MHTTLLRTSFEVMVANEPQLTRRFYAILFARHPRVVPLFARGPRAAQERMLAEALVALVDHLDDAAWLGATLPALGARHAGYGVTDEMSGWVGECLLAAMAEAAGAAWTPEVAAEWAGAYRAVAGLMLQGAIAAVATPRRLDASALAEVRGGSDVEYKYVTVRPSTDIKR